MKILTEAGMMVCNHETGMVAINASQHFVRIRGRKILVANDPELKPITGCTNSNPPIGIKPCTVSLNARTGYSRFVRINGRPVCLETVRGFTDGTPPGIIDYKVRTPGQELVSTSS
jgi:hypothetical protein